MIRFSGPTVGAHSREGDPDRATSPGCEESLHAGFDDRFVRQLDRERYDVPASKAAVHAGGERLLPLGELSSR